MVYGITGNTQKEKLWEPVAGLVTWLDERDLPFCIKDDVARGLTDRGLVAASLCRSHTESDLAAAADLILSFGGDGTFLRSAHEVGDGETPILGVNIGRLGFLADIEVGHLQETIERLEGGDYRVEERMVLESTIRNDRIQDVEWALNEFVIERSGRAGLITIEVRVDGVFLNNYYADGLIVSTATGSTAYSMSVGGPIVTPGCSIILLTPLAPHSLTVRPIVIPDTSVVEARVVTARQPYVLAADGRSREFVDQDIRFVMRRAGHTVKVVKLPEQHYFQTIRSKLMWGAHRHNG